MIERAPITGAGVFDLPLSEYLRDPAPAPSLSAGIAHKLLALSPAHAWHAYKEDQQSYRRDGALGTVFHALFLGKGGDYAIIDPADYPGERGGIPDGFTNKSIRAARDAVLLNGLTPILLDDFKVAAQMVELAAAQLEAHDIGNFTNEFDGKAEQTLLWQEGDVWCRACCDWLPDDLEAFPYIVNIKTTSCAEPDWWQRNALRCGYDLSEAHYLRGIRQLLGHEIRELFVCIESKPPYALSVNQLPNGALAMAERKRGYAVERWGECLRRNVWPAYARHICSLSETPGYHEAAFLESELSGKYSPEMLDQLIEAGAPTDKLMPVDRLDHMTPVEEDETRF